jgi:hypothetical protein
VNFVKRLFGFPELRDWLLAAGFTAVTGYGEDGRPLTADHKRMVIVAARPYSWPARRGASAGGRCAPPDGRTQLPLRARVAVAVRGVRLGVHEVAAVRSVFKLGARPGLGGRSARSACRRRSVMHEERTFARAYDYALAG